MSDRVLYTERVVATDPFWQKHNLRKCVGSAANYLPTLWTFVLTMKAAYYPSVPTIKMTR